MQDGIKIRRKGKCSLGVILFALAAVLCCNEDKVHAAQEDETQREHTLSGNIPSVFTESNNLESECDALNLKIEISSAGDKVILTGKKDTSVPYREELEIPEGITDITGGFDSDRTVKKLRIPSTVRNIGNAVFQKSSLEEVFFEDGAEVIGEKAFYQCKELRKVKLSSDITVIPKDCFRECIKLEEVQIPENVELIGEHAFMSTIIKELDLSRNKVKTLESAVFWQCTSLELVTLNEGLEKIGASAFWGCTALREINMPDSLKQIGYAAFESVYPEKLLDLSHTSLESIGESSFENTGLEEIILPDTVIEVGQNAFKNCTSVRRVNIPKSLVRVGSHGFSFNGTALENTELILPASIVEIRKEAFWGWTNLKTIDLSQAVNLSMGDNLFSDRTAFEIDTLKVSACVLDYDVRSRMRLSNMYCKKLVIEHSAVTEEGLAEERDAILQLAIFDLENIGLKTYNLESLEVSQNGENIDIVTLELQNQIAEDYYTTYNGLNKEELWKISFAATEERSRDFYHAIMSVPKKLGGYACGNFYELCLDMVKSGNIELLDTNVRGKVDELCGRLYETVSDAAGELPKRMEDLSIETGIGASSL